MDLKVSILILLSVVFAVSGQGYYGQRADSTPLKGYLWLTKYQYRIAVPASNSAGTDACSFKSVRRTGRIPAWCPPRSPRIRCLLNPCHGDTRSACPNYPNAVCVNDNPCEPWCIGHYYIGRQRRLTREECTGEGGDNQEPEVSCPPSRLRCLTNPCDVETCPAYPNARCVNDNPCEPFCIGHFYDGNRRLRRRQCRQTRRRN